MSEVNFVVYGKPISQGSKKAFVIRGTNRACIVEDNKKDLRAWRKQVQVEAAQAMNGQMLLDGPLHASILFYMMRPKSVSEKNRPWPDVRPDLSKITRAVEDALSGTVYRDDAQIVTMNMLKGYGDPPRAEITVYEIAK